jgi:hypothetical protein
MKPESEKYNKILNLLRESKPVLDSTEDIEREVIRKITVMNRSRLNLSEVLDFLFGWVYIGWVRRSLIAACVALVLIFVYQQGIILQRIDKISRQTIITDKENMLSPSDEIEKMLTNYKNLGRKFPSKTINISEKQMKQLLESVKELQIRYKDLEDIIESDPDLKRIIEKKLLENESTKINL